MSSHPLLPCSSKASRIMSAAACEVSWRKHCPFSSQITGPTGSLSSPRAKLCKWYRVIWYSHFIIGASFLLASCPPLGKRFIQGPIRGTAGEKSTLPIAFGQGNLQSVLSLPHFPGQKMTWIIHPRNLLAALAGIIILSFYFNESGKSPF